jgi:hypothetical protein
MSDVEMTRDQCGKCKFWRATFRDLSGICRRFPPVVLRRDESTYFPEVSARDWCGEYVEREEA